MTAFSISVTSDTVCPWCFVGKRKLEAGIVAYRAAHPGTADTFKTSWHPFYLDPDASPTGVDKQQMYAQKYGAERTALMQQRLSAEGAKVGIKFAYGGKMGRTRDSHRVIALALSRGGEDLQNRVVEQLFTAYFEREQDITSWDVLVQAAVAGGLDGEEVRQCLKSGEGGELVDREVEVALRSLVTGVPNFVINGKYEIQGAQDPEGFRRVFEKIKETDG